MTTQTLRTKDHPEANGRIPQHGDTQWDLKFVLEDGSTLVLQLGRTTHDGIRGAMLQEEVHTAADEAQEKLR